MTEAPPPTPVFRSLGAVPQERFQRAADRHGLGRVLSVEVLGGAYGNNVGITTERGAWVLRGAVPPLDLATLRRELFFARTIHERSSLAAPWPYLIDESDAIFGWPYAIMRRLAGKVLHPAQDLNWIRIGHALGRAAAELHAIRFPCIGEWDAGQDGIVSPGLPPPKWFERRVTGRKQRVAAASAPLDPASSSLIDGLVRGAIPAIGDFEPAYVHGDLGIGNLTGERTSQGFSFTGVFDLGGGYAGDPGEDLATPLWWPLYWRNADLPRAFLESYRTEYPPRPGERPRLLAYVAASLLANWEAGRCQGFDWYGGSRTFSEWALPLLDQVDAMIVAI